MRRFATIVMTTTVCAGLVALAPKAFAQIPEVIMPGPAWSQQLDNQGAPRIAADRLEVHNRSKTANFSGNVRLVQGDTTMRCSSLVVFYGHEIGPSEPTTGEVTPREAHNISRMEARGRVTVVTRDESASADL